MVGECNSETVCGGPGKARGVHQLSKSYRPRLKAV
jgi:hypothetical protein